MPDDDIIKDAASLADWGIIAEGEAEARRDRLNSLDQHIVDSARQLAALRAGDVREYTGETDLAMAMANMVGQLQHTVAALIGIIERSGTAAAG